VIRTRVGYTGGKKKKPIYHNLGDHTEAIQIDYDPTKISYKELLDIFWESHNPAISSWSRQYMSAVYFHNEEQKRLAIETKNSEEAKHKGKIYTEIVPASEFYTAEGYHQKYLLRQRPALMKEFNVLYPATEDFVNSTAAARINGYLGGYRTLTALEAELNTLNLPPETNKKLLDILGKLNR
jgi:peptide-methionine (S)-S-oxide reductase